MEAWLKSVLREASDALAERRYPQAHAALMKVVQAAPQTAEAYYLLGILAADHQNHGKACELFDRALTLSPGVSRYHADKARSLVALFQRDAAQAHAEAATAGANLSARTLDTVGVVFSRLGLHARAADFYAKATVLEPDNPGFLYNRAAGEQFLGALGAAEATFKRVIEVEPGHVKAWSSLVMLAKQKADNHHTVALKALFDTLTDPDDRLHIGHALAKTFEDIGDPDATMTWLQAAKARKRDTVRHDPQATAALFSAAAATAHAALLAEVCGDASPLFIVGLPRTGTTLVDRILSQHSAVQSAGELSDFALELKAVARTPSPYVLDPETLTAAARLPLAGPAAAYIARARRVVSDAPHFIDKMPLNFFYAALILRAMPRARVICLRRHPLDTILSNYRQMFATGYSYYNYNYDLRWTAEYYAHFDALMAGFRQTLPADRFTEVAYEAVVEDLEGEARRLVAFCGLSWEPQCVAFHENAAPVATASSSQVRQPLYASSVGRWRRYLAHLGPAIEVLDARGIAWDGPALA